MAVQAQYPSNVLLLNRNVQESNDFSLQQQPGVGGGGGGFWELIRGKEAGMFQQQLQQQEQLLIHSIFLYKIKIKNQNNQLIDLSQLQNHQQPNVVSTGLRLSFGDQIINFNNNNNIIINNNNNNKFNNNPIHFFLFCLKNFPTNSNNRGEQLRRTLVDKRQKHYRALLGAAEETVARRMREKEAEMEKAARKNAELEARAAQLNAEAQAWQAKARAQEAQAAALQAQIHQAMVGPNGALQQDREGSGLGCAGDAEGAESAYVDQRVKDESPRRVVKYVGHVSRRWCFCPVGICACVGSVTTSFKLAHFVSL
ncbi:putative BOI-related E3 ubiquitin-protein ligase 2 [Bienertia sinuspersici]